LAAFWQQIFNGLQKTLLFLPFLEQSVELASSFRSSGLWHSSQMVLKFPVPYRHSRRLFASVPDE
jgi:hypothetical protein